MSVRKSLLLLCIVAIVLAGSCKRRPSASQIMGATALKKFINLHLTEPEYKPDTESLKTIIEMGDRAVPKLMAVLGQAAAPDRQVKRSDYWLIVILTRMGTGKAVDSVITILKHDYEGDIATDRQVAARALVALGAKKATSTLKKVIKEHQAWTEQQLQQSGASGDSPEGKKYKKQIDNLNKALEKLKSGQGKIDHSNFR